MLKLPNFNTSAFSLCYSLRCKRFRLVSEQRTDRGRGLSLLTAREMKREPKGERGGRGRGRKETLADKPLDFENLRWPANVACVAWRFWLLSNKGGRGQKNREEIGAGATGFFFFSRLRRSCARLDKTAMLRRLQRTQRLIGSASRTMLTCVDQRFVSY